MTALSSTSMAQERTTDTPAATRITFDEAIRRATARNPNSELAQQEVRRSQALVEQVRAGWLPTLTANATYMRLDADRVFNDRVVQGADSFNGNVSLSVPIIAPRAWVAHARARDNVELAGMSLADARREVAVATGRAYLTVVGQRRILESSERALTTARAHEDFARSRLAGDVGNRIDVARATQERATSETRVQNQRIALTRAQEALGVLLGENGPLDAGDAILATPPPTLAVALREADALRSDVVVSRERAAVAHRSVRDSYADYLPTLAAVAQPFYQNPPTITLPTTGWQALLVLTVPIYDGGNRYGLAHERQALEAQARTRVEATLRQARSEVRVAFEAVQRVDEALARAHEAAAAAHEALELSQLAYRAGATSNIEVVDAERRALDAETDAAVAEDAARQARLDLLASSGRFPAP
jgi:outer membrane protein TolC